MTTTTTLYRSLGRSFSSSSYWLRSAGTSRWTAVASTQQVVVARPYATSRVLSEKKAETKPKGIPYSQLTVGIPKEDVPLERRVAATPESVARLVKPGFTVLIQDGAGDASHFSNAAYEAAGAKIVTDVWKDSDIVLKV